MSSPSFLPYKLLLYAKNIEDFINADSFLVKVGRFTAGLQERCEYNYGAAPELVSVR